MKIAYTSNPVNTASGLKCWNCDGNHSVKDCPEPIDEVLVEKNRKEYVQQRNERRERAKKGKTSKPTPHAWRPPEDDEHGKHIIYGRPYTWNESRRGWDKDETPDTGISAGTSAGAHKAALPGTTGSAASDTGTLDDGTVLTQGTMPPHEFAQLTLDIANVSQALARYA